MINSVHFIFLIFLGMLSLVLVLIIVVIIYSFYQYKVSVRLSGWSEIINKTITKVIVYEEDEVSPDRDFIIANGNPSFRNLFLQKLVDSEKKFSGVAQNKIKYLFEQYNLQEDALKKLNQKKLYLTAGGIQELTAMNAEGSLPEISRFLAHPSPQVYQEAQYALVNFKGFEGLHYLNTIPTVISEWQQLRLLRSINHIPENSEGIIKGWLESSNNSVVIFTLKLLRKFQVLTVYSIVTQLLAHPSTEVRVQTIQTLLSLENPSTITCFTDVYPDQPIEVQLEILKAIKTSGDKRSTDFLKKQLLDNTETGIKVCAAQALFSLEEKQYLAQMAENESSSEELIKIIKYALQEKIC
ncbi:MAG: repeat protein [Chryseobacterium sp.]|uniref:HEAT repeat domain-containing protein n=1 Tax=Chryseobacterium sp. TaxID=1871047 RepID=UPI00260E9D54|nr:HEAT repeat domain-containing protein [Chryseobacterium sp.]MDF2553589.1 repeat protein [Chryseobacterium sp.]